jgi:hypothetical protein
MQKRTFQAKRVTILCAASLGLAFTASAQSVATTVTETPGNYSRATTVTGENGKTATYQNNKSWGNGAYSDTRSYTGVNGGTRTDTVSRSDGNITKTVTGRNGNSRTFTRAARDHR